MWRPEEKIEKPTDPFIQPVNYGQTHEIKALGRSPHDDISDIDIDECAFMSAKPACPIRSPMIDKRSSLSACVAMDDVVLNKMPANYVIRSMAHAHDSRYVMRVYDRDAQTKVIYDADIDTHDIAKIGDYGYVINIVTRGNIVVMFKYDGNAIVLENRIDAGQIDIKCKCAHASGNDIQDRYCQQTDDDIYVVDTSARLWRVSWHDVKTRRYGVKCLIYNDLEDFYMHEHGNAILKTTGIIALSGGRSINMQDVDGSVKWSAVIRSANRWIACGDKKDMSTIASIDDRGLVISSMSIRTTAVSKFAFIRYLKTAIVTGDQAIILAMELSACCHLISMTASGRLHLIESMPSIRRPDVKYPGDGWKIIESMTESDVEGQYIVAGYMWIKKLTVRLN